MELVVYRFSTVSDSLPPIFHYWTNTYLRPKFERVGYSSPDDFFFKRVLRHAQDRRAEIKILSVGAGRCESEIALATKLRSAGSGAVKFVCVDINRNMLHDAQTSARSQGVGDLFSFVVADVADLSRDDRYDVVLANQCLHHFANLEAVLETIHQCLEDDGVFVTCDVIGRNGHQLWPEALQEVEALWDTLPARYKYDRTEGATMEKYVNYDHSDVAFEGVRAQEILPRLIQLFHFEIFLPYACIIMPFIERRFGFNFDPNVPADRAFIDLVATRDETLIRSGKIKPTQLLASLRKAPVADPVSIDDSFSPESCVRHY